MLKRVIYSTGTILPDEDCLAWADPSANNTISAQSQRLVRVQFFEDDGLTARMLAEGETLTWEAKDPDDLDALYPVLSVDTFTPDIDGQGYVGTLVVSAIPADDPTLLVGQFARFPDGETVPFRTDRHEVYLAKAVASVGGVLPFAPLGFWRAVPVPTGEDTPGQLFDAALDLANRRVIVYVGGPGYNWGQILLTDAFT